MGADALGAAQLVGNSRCWNREGMRGPDPAVPRRWPPRHRAPASSSASSSSAALAEAQEEDSRCTPKQRRPTFLVIFKRHQEQSKGGRSPEAREVFKTLVLRSPMGIRKANVVLLDLSDRMQPAVGESRHCQRLRNLSYCFYPVFEHLKPPKQVSSSAGLIKILYIMDTSARGFVLRK